MTGELRFIGLVMTENTQQRTVFESVVKEPENQFDTLLRRAGHQYDMLADALVASAKGELTPLEVKNQERLLDDTLLYCMRYLNKYEDREHAYRYFNLLSTLEEGADAIRKISEHIDDDEKLAIRIKQSSKKYIKALFEGNQLEAYTTLRKLRNSVENGKRFVEGLVHAYAETLYNYLIYQIGIK